MFTSFIKVRYVTPKTVPILFPVVLGGFPASVMGAELPGFFGHMTSAALSLMH